MRLSIVGSGYVGTTIAACFADLGHTVTNVDIDGDVVAAINAGEAPMEEPGLAPLLDAHAGDRLTASTDYDAIRGTDVTFLALPTPANDDGSIDASIIEAGAEATAEALADKDGHHTVVIKSTVVPDVITDRLAPALNAVEDVSVAVNPEFLREGSAVEDFLHPHKLVFGTDPDDDRALETLRAVYAPLLDRHDAPVVETTPREAAMIKYANNAFLAAKVSLINDIGNVCKEHGIDAYEVADAIGLDDRIGAKFLRSGLGWGGSCFPKDIKSLIYSATEHGYTPEVLEAAVRVNDGQPRRFLRLLDQHVDVTGERVAVLGLAFKPGTDDVRNARSIPVIEGLRERGAEVIAYDPAAMGNMREVFPDVTYADSAADAVEDAVAVLIVTEWDEIAALDGEFDRMATPVVIDGRHAIERRDGIVYEGLTW